MNFKFSSRQMALLILGLAALLRLFLLEIKPPHFDEGVNGWFVDEMVKSGYFHYDPDNYHGPLHFYLLFLLQTLFGRHIWALRLSAVAASLATIGLVLGLKRFLPNRACQIAALALAVSPAEVFYARYAIHEAELVFFLVLTAWGIGVLWQSGERKGLWALGIGLAGMLLTKETYVIHLVCLGLTLLCLRIWERISPFLPPPAPQLWNRRTLENVVGCCLLLIVFFYSGGFLDPSSLKGLYQTYAAWVHTGTHGAGHEKPFYYWVYLMGILEWPAAIGLIYGGARSLSELWKGFRGKGETVQEGDISLCACRFISVYGIGTLVAYSLVPYKTPWCIITLIWPFFLLFGLAADQLRNRLGKSLALAILTPLMAAALGVSIWLNFFHYTDENVPYVYVQTTKEVRQLTGPLFKLVDQNPADYAMRGSILLESYYPLPWILGDFPHVAYFNPDKLNDSSDPPSFRAADFLLIQSDRAGKVEAALAEPYFKSSLRLRGGMEPAWLYLREAKFRPLFPNRTAEFKPNPSQ